MAKHSQRPRRAAVYRATRPYWAAAVSLSPSISNSTAIGAGGAGRGCSGTSTTTASTATVFTPSSETAAPPQLFSTDS